MDEKTMAVARRIFNKQWELEMRTYDELIKTVSTNKAAAQAVAEHPVDWSMPSFEITTGPNYAFGHIKLECHFKKNTPDAKKKATIDLLRHAFTTAMNESSELFAELVEKSLLRQSARLKQEVATELKELLAYADGKESEDSSS
jgi:hypothetical protein